MVCLILGILWFAGILYWDIKSDFKKWQNNIPVDHKKEGLIRGVLLIPSIFLLSLPDLSLVNFLFAGLMEAAVWWELFDGFYNKLRGFSWRFNGSVDPDDSKLDKFLYKLNDTEETLLKWGLIALFTTLYIIT